MSGSVYLPDGLSPYSPTLAVGIGDGDYDITLTNGTATTVATIIIADSSIVAIEAYVCAKKLAADLEAFLASRHVVKRIASTVTDIDAVEVLAKRPSTTLWSLSFVIADGTVLVQVTGETGVRCVVSVKVLVNTF